MTRPHIGGVSGMSIRKGSVSEEAVAHREQVDTLVDSTSRARYYSGLGSSATDLKMVDKINAFADKYIAPT